MRSHRGTQGASTKSDYTIPLPSSRITCSSTASGGLVSRWDPLTEPCLLHTEWTRLPNCLIIAPVHLVCESWWKEEGAHGPEPQPSSYSPGHFLLSTQRPLQVSPGPPQFFLLPTQWLGERQPLPHQGHRLWASVCEEPAPSGLRMLCVLGGGCSHWAWAEACDPTAGIFLAFSLTECFQISLLLTSKENESVFFSSQSESLLQNIKVSMINVSCASKL